MPLTPEERRARQRKYARRHYQKNREKILIRVNRWVEANREKVRARQREWAKKNYQKVRANQRAHKKRSAAKDYALFRKREYDGWLRRREREAGRPRPECCDVCGKHAPRIVFDHCHQRGIFRGWLCTDCNIILGHAHDDPDVLLKLAAYLRRTAGLLPPQLTLPGI